MNTDVPGEQYLVLGLYREMTGPYPTKKRSLPAALQNLPDAHPPPEVPIVTLAAIEVSLECGYLFHPDKQSQKLSITVDTETEPRYSTQFFASCPDLLIDLTLDSSVGFTGFAESDSIRKEDKVDQASQSLLALVDFGLQELLSTTATKCSDVQVIESNLQPLCKLAPVIFNPRYREVRPENPESVCSD